MIPINTNQKLIWDFLSVINTNLALILHHFRDIAFNRSNKSRYIRLPLLCLTSPTEEFPWDDLRKILPGCQQMASLPNGVEIETLPKITIAWVGCTNITDRQTDGRWHIANVNVTKNRRIRRWVMGIRHIFFSHFTLWSSNATRVGMNTV